MPTLGERLASDDEDEIVLGAGEYLENVVIERPVTVRGAGRATWIGARAGSVIQILSPGVVLCDLVVESLVPGGVAIEATAGTTPRLTRVEIVGDVIGVPVSVPVADDDVKIRIVTPPPLSFPPASIERPETSPTSAARRQLSLASSDGLAHALYDGARGDELLATFAEPSTPTAAPVAESRGYARGVAMLFGLAASWGAIEAWFRVSSPLARWPLTIVLCAIIALSVLSTLVEEDGRPRFELAIAGGFLGVALMVGASHGAGIGGLYQGGSIAEWLWLPGLQGALTARWARQGAAGVLRVLCTLMLLACLAIGLGPLIVKIARSPHEPKASSTALAPPPKPAPAVQVTPIRVSPCANSVCEPVSPDLCPDFECDEVRATIAKLRAATAQRRGTSAQRAAFRAAYEESKLAKKKACAPDYPVAADCKAARIAIRAALAPVSSHTKRQKPAAVDEAYPPPSSSSVDLLEESPE